ncbi:MAG: DUF4199 domain-containing protein [Flavobacteriaceae bacterium]|nr:DUF4199 domain-containing protein [Mangrovimonas sp.]MCB0469793.1 DUF4199 domain-containing protein [Flavobacteriaceae bacterium]MCB0432727.1 DUF4199 domain-containing protein [Mangrovimonas sp.]MCB0435646.1 DUF4199 domain-containing protein [Mangrovimonas sp.]MCB0439441.1 DUF4199 domain-containing protein [Mangrovimonas sp.]
METQKTSPGKFSVSYGIILGVIMIILAVVMYVTGMALEGKQWPQYLYYLIFPALIIYAISKYKKLNANILSLGDAIKIGLVAGVVSGVVYGIYNLLFHYVIDPEFLDKVMSMVKDKLMENPDMTEEMAEQSLSFMKKIFSPGIGTAIWIALSAIFGLIYSLIGGLIMKNEE